MIHKLGLDKLLLGKRHHLRELSLAQALAPGAEHHSLGEVLGLGEMCKAIDPAIPEGWQEKREIGEICAAMDWLLERQTSVEDVLPKRHLTGGCTVLYGLSWRFAPRQG